MLIDCSKIYSDGPTTGWRINIPTGKLINTSSEMPLELGKVKSQALRQGNYKIIIAYSDKNHHLITDREFERYKRDAKDKGEDKGEDPDIRQNHRIQENCPLSGSDPSTPATITAG